MANDFLDDPVNPTDTDIALTPLQEKQLFTLWNSNNGKPPGLIELTQAIFGKEYDIRSAQAKAIKKALARQKSKSSSESKTIELSEAHKAYITNHAKHMSTLELARNIFANPNLTPLNAECRVVQQFRNTLMPNTTFNPGEPPMIATSPYLAPKTLAEAADRVNLYINFSYNKDKLTPTHKKHLSTLIGYLHTYRFSAQMNNYVSEGDRKLAEDAFIRATFDKPDLAQEEIDQYIEYANQVVAGFTIQRRLNQLSQQLEDVSSSQDGQGETIKITMPLVEAIGKASTEYHQCQSRQQKLLEDLKGKRSARLDKQIKDTPSVLNLIQLWREEESRKELLAHAEKEQESVNEEVKRLSSLSDIKARIMGLTKEEILYG